MLCKFGGHTFVPIPWACKKKQTAVPHSSTEAEVISLDTGLRMEGLLALKCVIDVLEYVASRASSDPSRQLNSKTSGTIQFGFFRKNRKQCFKNVGKAHRHL